MALATVSTSIHRAGGSPLAAGNHCSSSVPTSVAARRSVDSYLMVALLSSLTGNEITTDEQLEKARRFRDEGESGDRLVRAKVHRGTFVRGWAIVLR